LASGSKGNCTYISTENHKLLIDIGTTCLYVEKTLKSMDVDPSQIDSIFITHTHVDHISGLKVFCKKYNPTVYLTKKMHDEIEQQFKIKNYVYLDEFLEIDDLIVNVIKTSHDSEESVGYIFESNGKNVVYISDTGYINRRYFSKLQNKDLYILESNHDVGMLMQTKRPHHIKIRIIGDEGHLSNKDASNYLARFVGPKTKHIILVHLSEEANDSVLARKTLEQVLKMHNCSVNSIIVASQKERTELIEI
jgi:phosphoribosyl 1,2-cyclic phosphodiesterase